MLFANGVNLNDTLRTSSKGINQKSQGRLQEALGRIGTRQTASNTASGRVQGEYAPAMLEQAGTEASGDIESQLLAALGGGSYDELLKQKEHEQNLALAKRIGGLNKGGSAQELLAALGAAGQLGGTVYGAYKGMPKDTSRVGSTPGSLSQNMSLYGSREGYGRYQ